METARRGGSGGRTKREVARKEGRGRKEKEEEEEEGERRTMTL